MKIGPNEAIIIAHEKNYLNIVEYLHEIGYDDDWKPEQYCEVFA